MGKADGWNFKGRSARFFTRSLFGKWTKQMVAFSKEGQQDPSPEAFIESELSLIRKSLYRSE